MTIDEVRAAQAVLESQITALVQGFQTATSTRVHSIPVEHPASTPDKTFVRVKVQI